MKKTFIIFSCAFSLCFFGCASKDVASVINEEISAPETEIQNDETDESAEASGLEESQNEEETEDFSDSEDEDNFITDSTNDYLELDDIDEPIVITLDPPVEEELDFIEENDEQPAEEFLEPAEVELPKEEPSTVEDHDTSVLDDNTKSSDEKNVNDINEEDDSISDENSDDVIDITDDDASAIEDESEKVVEEIIPSRRVTMKKSEYVDIVYPGNGWVFMGLVDGSKDLTYFGRKLGTGQTKFTLQAKNAGTKIVHFYKEDNLTAQTLDDYIEIEVLNEKGSNKDHVTAPEYKLPLTKKAKEVIETNRKKLEAEVQTSEIKNEADNQGTPKEEPKEVTKKEPEIQNIKKQTVELPKEVKKIKETPAVEKQETSTPPADAKLLLKEAQLLYNEKEYEAANKKLDNFFEVAVNKRDEGLFLRGQILEAKSSIQNVKEAIESYTSLTKNYPASKYWDDANKRIIYLKRFYLEVR